MIDSNLRKARREVNSLRFVALLVALTLTSSCGETDQQPLAGSTAVGVLINPEMLRTMRAASEVVLLDVRPREEYDKGHLPGAVHFDVEHTWSEPAPKSLMKGVAAMSRVLSEHGLNSTARTVIYDDGRYLNAARLFWVLECHGHVALHVLEGGFQRWSVEGLEVSTDPEDSLPVSEFNPLVQPFCLATTDQVFQAIELKDVILLDSRPMAEFVGEISKSNRTGRIPTALHFPWSGNLSVRSSTGDVQEESPQDAVGRILKEGFREGEWLQLTSLTPPHPTSQGQNDQNPKYIVYCNRGKQSAVSYLALRHSQVQSSVYDGSWLEWCRIEEMPVDEDPIQSNETVK